MLDTVSNKCLVKWNIPTIVFLCIFGASCSRESGPKTSEPKAPIVRTHRLYFTMERVLTIGEAQGLDSPVSLAKHPDGMLVLDYDAKKAVALTDEGTVLFEFGQPGNGPGEFQKPLKICTGDDLVFVYDLGTRTLSQFNIQGVFKKHFKLKRPCTNIFFSEGHFYFSYFHRKGLPDIEILTTDLDVVGKISLRNADDNTYYATTALNAEGMLFAAPLNKYVIEVYDKAGVFVRQFSREYDAPPYVFYPGSNMEINHVPISGITFSQKYVYVLYGGHQTVYEKLTHTKMDPEYDMRVDVFDWDGNFVGWFWDDKLSPKMGEVHNSPIFWMDKEDQLWIQDTEDFRLIHKYRVEPVQ